MKRLLFLIVSIGLVGLISEKAYPQIFKDFKKPQPKLVLLASKIDNQNIVLKIILLRQTSQINFIAVCNRKFGVLEIKRITESNIIGFSKGKANLEISKLYDVSPEQIMIVKRVNGEYSYSKIMSNEKVLMLFALVDAFFYENTLPYIDFGIITKTARFSEQISIQILSAEYPAEWCWQDLEIFGPQNLG